MFQYIQKKDRIVVNPGTESKVIILSRMYPLEEKSCQIFTSDNTLPLERDDVTQIFDSIAPQVGRCFTNSEKLVNALRKAGYPAKQYVGWLFIQGATYPVHHSFVVLEKHIMDLSIEMLSKDINSYKESVLLKRMNRYEARKQIAQMYHEKKALPNHEKCIFGKCDPYYMYIAAEGNAVQGKERNALLRREYPQHPAFKNLDLNGMTEIQRMLYG